MNLQGITQPLHHVWERAGQTGHQIIEGISSLTLRGGRALLSQSPAEDYMTQALNETGRQLAQEAGRASDYKGEPIYKI